MLHPSDCFSLVASHEHIHNVPKFQIIAMWSKRCEVHHYGSNVTDNADTATRFITTTGLTDRRQCLKSLTMTQSAVKYKSRYVENMVVHMRCNPQPAIINN